MSSPKSYQPGFTPIEGQLSAVDPRLTSGDNGMVGLDDRKQLAGRRLRGSYMDTSASPIGTVLIIRVWSDSVDQLGFRARVIHGLTTKDSFTSVIVTSPE